MNYWRMTFRDGSQGYEMWPDCYERGIEGSFWAGQALPLQIYHPGVEVH